jgi:hypothetical protein
MYLCVRGSDFASFFHFSIGLWYYSESDFFFTKDQYVEGGGVFDAYSGVQHIYE